MSSRRLGLLNAWLRRVEKPALSRATPLKARARFEREAWLFPHPKGAVYHRDTLGGVPVTWALNRPVGDDVILYLHGGAHIMGSPATHRAMLAHLAGLTGFRACLPAMRLAPEHPYPAGLDDALEAWQGLTARGHAPGRIVLGGDSAGGGLMLALLARLLAAGIRPAGAFAFSPWTDLAATGASLAENADSDPLLPVGRLDEARGLYLSGADPHDPGASPLYADFPDCPPVFLQASQSEILRDDTLRMAARLEGFGAAVTLDLWDETPHVWTLFQGFLPEADTALATTARFIRGLVPTG